MNETDYNKKIDNLKAKLDDALEQNRILRHRKDQLTETVAELIHSKIKDHNTGDYYSITINVSKSLRNSPIVSRLIERKAIDLGREVLAKITAE